MTTALVLLPLAYLVGATPTSYWVGRAVFGVDLREEGSGNLGATNAFRVLGWRAALPVVTVDILKGWTPTALLPLALPDPGIGWALAYGGAAIAGHVWSFWVGFRGGKGVATSAGVFVALAPWAVLVVAVVWAAIVFGTGYVSLGSLTAAALLPLLLVVTPHRGGTGLVGFTFALAAFVIWAHRGNIRRLVRGEENRFGRRGREA